MQFIEIQTLCRSKDEYLTRPDLGRRFSKENADKIKQDITGHPEVQIVIGDGLSSAQSKRIFRISFRQLNKD